VSRSGPSSSFDPYDFLRLAEDLARKPDPSQAELRAAVGRAYYAIFLQGRARLMARGRMNATGTGDEHRIVTRRLRQRSRALGATANALRTQRNRADYNLLARFVAADVRRTVENARRLYSRL